LCSLKVLILFQHEKLFQMMYCSFNEGLEIDLHDVIETYQCVDLIPKMLISKIERD
jgi:hypothetical protein